MYAKLKLKRSPERSRNIKTPMKSDHNVKAAQARERKEAHTNKRPAVRPIASQRP